ncbi:hypothetical protein [Tsuneonella mangrovi]|uniref:hypothetical protein n=1 Tax=Tsuneonella mangrovi TaxID=1982042 RepID=UPI000BA1F717|nr:hypothetical protein [Tsuneonella mangrovi]
MGILRIILQVVGGFLTFAGSFFALQGAGVIMWPPESYMLADGQWVINGAIIALVGIGVFVLGRKIGR